MSLSNSEANIASVFPNSTDVVYNNSSLVRWLTILDKISAEQDKAFKSLEILLNQHKKYFEKPRQEHEEFLSNEKLKFI
ncbi:hypothetical protein B1207_06355 [Legionella quinlivanii]|uniref:Uncharacterized protein n=1 Tax=Legionella quinlivanii TaxID=45073 RepID=A0A364LKA9_9GAMM|nr:hypothetical protein B1207_06355 [Legionella quinlivanii]